MGGPENLKGGSVHPSVRPIHFSSANQIRVFLFSANREPRPGRFDWSFELPSLIAPDQVIKIYPGVSFEPRVQPRWERERQDGPL